MASTFTLSEASRRHPGLTTIALRDIPEPDYADISLVPLPPGATTDPEAWAKAVFDLQGLPGWVRRLMVLRQALVGLIGVRKGDASVFDVDERHGDEVLIAADEGHLDMRVGVGVRVGVGPGAGFVWCATVVRLHGARGRIYFAPVRLLHARIVRSMMDGAAQRLTPESAPHSLDGASLPSRHGDRRPSSVPGRRNVQEHSTGEDHSTVRGAPVCGG